MSLTTCISCAEAVKVGVGALEAIGVLPAHAQLQVELLVDAEMRGRASHGLLRLPRLIERIKNGVADPNARGVHDWRGQSLLHVDGEAGLGPVVATSAIDALAGRLKQSGVALCAISNNNHLGMLGWYAERYAKQGYILLGLTTSEALMHPYGGRTALIGTNPITIGIPTLDQPFVLDMATSLVSMGQIHERAASGEALAPGWALDKDGHPTVDANSAKSGAIAPFGGAKGYALGLAFELLVAALTASALGKDVRGTLDSTSFCNKGDVFILIDPAISPATAQLMQAYLNDIRASGDPDGQPVLVPGDRSLEAHAKSLKDGMNIPTTLWQQICNLSDGRAHAAQGGV